MLKRLQGWIHKRRRRERPALDILVSMLMPFEGFRSEAYQCSAGVWTYGYGSTRTPNGKRVEQYFTITKSEARALLTEEAVYVLNRARALTDGYSPTNGCLAAIASLIYNVGEKAVAKSRFLAAWKRCDMEQARIEFVDFNKVSGKVVRGLTRRREAEWKVLTGKA